jgi:hypothetical protein
MRSKPHRYRREDPLIVRFTLWVLKSALGGLAFVLAGVALANYQVILHHDGQVEFARKNAWTLADTFRFVGEAALGTPAPVVIAAAPVASPQPALLSQAGVIVAPSSAPPPAPASVAPPAPPPAPARVTSPPPPARPVKPVKVVKAPVAKVEEEEEEEEEPEGAAECRTVRASLGRAVAKFERARGEKMSELRIFDLIGAGCLRDIVSCPSMGGLAIRRGRSGAEVRCTIHGPK